MNIKIESSANPTFKKVKKLQSKSGRTKLNQYIAEGVRGVSDAVKNGAEVECIILCEGTSISFDTKNIRVYEMAKALFDELKLTVSSQGIIAVINYTLPDASKIDATDMQTIVYLDSVTDPGNMGTIIRSCDALGADAIILSKGCVDIFNPKVVRSTMASLFNVPIFFDTTSDCLTLLLEENFSIIGTFPRDAEILSEANFDTKNVIVMGNEANGISKDIEALCTRRVTIPMRGQSESLNVATALTVVLYEIMRKRGDK